MLILTCCFEVMRCAISMFPEDEEVKNSAHYYRPYTVALLPDATLLVVAAHR